MPQHKPLMAGGATLKTYMLVNTVYDLQNMNNNKAGTYALGRDIDAGITSTWNSGAGFLPIGANNSFTGNLDGQGHTISGLFINRPSDQNVGLVGYLGPGATVSNVGVIGATVTGVPTMKWNAVDYAATYTVEVYKNGDDNFSPANKVLTQITKFSAWTPTTRTC